MGYYNFNINCTLILLSEWFRTYTIQIALLTQSTLDIDSSRVRHLACLVKWDIFGWLRIVKTRGFSQLFLLWNIYIFPFSTALRKQQKILACFPEDKLSTIYLDLQIHPPPPTPALNASCVLLEHQWMFEPFLIVVFESLNCPQCEKMDLKIRQSLLERVQICKRCWKTEESAGHGGFFWRTVLSSTVQNKQGTHEQPTQNKQTKQNRTRKNSRRSSR